MDRLLVVTVLFILMLTCCSNLPFPSQDRAVDQDNTQNDSAIEKTRGTTIIVDKNGNGDYTTIQAGVDAANAGDTVRVWDGVYYERVNIDKTISLIGNGSDTTTINGTNFGGVVSIWSNWCNVSGFNITITNCSFWFNDYGLIMSDTKDCQIFNCEFHKGFSGIMLSESNNCQVVNVTASDTMESGINLVSSDDNDISQCTLKNNLGHGMIVYNSKKNHVHNNTIMSNNFDGISISGSKNNIFQHNLIADNKRVGINVDSSSASNSILINNIISNGALQAIDNGTSNIWNNSQCGNYWSDWTSPDSEPDGIVDNPYNINGTSGSKDFYPLTDPYGELVLYVPSNRTLLEDVHYQKECHMSNYPFPVSWKFSSNASWLDPFQNHIISGIPGNGDVGTYWVNISVSDVVHSDFENFTLEVLNVNDPPEIDTNDIQNVMEDDYFYCDYSASDIDPTNDILIWDCITNSTFISFDKSTAILNGTPTNDDVGNYWINISVADGNGGEDVSNFTLTVHNTNDPPVFNTSNVETCLEDELYSVLYSGFDVDPTNDTLSWNLTSDAVFLKIGTTNGTLYGIPENSDVGIHWVNVSLWDDNYANDFSNFTLTVQNVNDDPEILTEVIDTCKEDEEYSCTFTAEDIDPTEDSLSWAFSSNADFLSFDTITGKLSGTPGNQYVGEYWVNVSVADGLGGRDFRNYTLTVANINDPPVLDLMGTITIDEDVIFFVQFIANDLDGDVIHYQSNLLDVIPLLKDEGFYSIDETTGWIGINATNSMVGKYEFNISCDDNNGGVDTITIGLEVRNSNDRPWCEIVSPADGTSYRVGDEIVFRANWTDDDMIWGDVLNFTWTSNTSGLLGYGQNMTIILEEIGIHKVILEVSDGESLFESNVMITIISNNSGGPVIPEDEDDKKEDDGFKLGFLNIVLIIGLILFLIFDVIIFYLFFFRKKKEEEMDIEEPDVLYDPEEDEDGEEQEETAAIEEGAVTPEDVEEEEEAEIKQEFLLPPAREVTPDELDEGEKASIYDPDLDVENPVIIDVPEEDELDSI